MKWLPIKPQPPVTKILTASILYRRIRAVLEAFRFDQEHVRNGSRSYFHQDSSPARAPRSRRTFAGTPAATTRSGIGLLTTAPAPTIASRPTSAITTALLPIHAPAPIRTVV